MIINVPRLKPSSFSENGFSIEKLLSKYEEHKNILLLCGQVQSGKTHWIIEIIKKAFNNFDYDYIFFISGINSFLFDQSNDRLEQEGIRFIKTLNDNQTIRPKFVYSVLKEDDWLKKLKNIISQISYENKRILIIDDESDYATPNSSKKDGQTKINELIFDSYNQIIADKGGLLYVTATPYANITNNKDKFKPDYVFCLPINENYTGLSFFNSLKDFYVCDMDLDDKNDLDFIYFSFIFWLLKTYLFFNEYNNEKSDLLIYVSDNTTDHSEIKDFVQQMISDLRTIDKKLNNKMLFTINETIANYNLDINLDEFINFIQNKFNEIEKVPFLFNSKGNNKSELKRYKESNNKMKVIIGGRFLSRGFTYGNLLTECFLYVSKNEPAADTILQRCRWFGYRQATPKNNVNRYKYMNVITKTYIKHIFEQIESFNNLICHNNGLVISFNNFYNKVTIVNKNSCVKGTSNAKK